MCCLLLQTRALQDSRLSMHVIAGRYRQGNNLELLVEPEGSLWAEQYLLAGGCGQTGSSPVVIIAIVIILSFCQIIIAPSIPIQAFITLKQLAAPLPSQLPTDHLLKCDKSCLIVSQCICEIGQYLCLVLNVEIAIIVRSQMRSFSTYVAHDANQPDQITWNPLSNHDAHKKSERTINLTEVFKAHHLFSQSDIVEETALIHSPRLSQEYEANIYLKREDHQRGRTFKIRGAYYQYLISDEKRRREGFVIVSDGNFATSFSIISGMFKVKTFIFVPETCHLHKLAVIRREGKESVEIIQTGIDFEQCTQHAFAYSQEHGLPMLKSFDDATLMNGFATIGKEVLEADKKREVNYVVVPAGGGALASSIGSLVKQISPSTKVIAVEPDNCKPYSSSILAGKLIPFEKVSKFCNGSSVRTTSELAYSIGRTSVDGFVDVSEKKLAEMIIQLYSLGFICEPSGALSIAALDKMRHEIKGKNVVCILSGANIDLTKLDQARQIAAISKGIKNHYHIHLPNRTGVMHDLITKCFKKTDIISVQYSQRFGKDSSQLLLSVESVTQQDVEEYIEKMVEGKFNFENINEKEDLLDIFF